MILEGVSDEVFYLFMISMVGCVGWMCVWMKYRVGGRGRDEGEFSCPICLEDDLDITTLSIQTNCSHLFCPSCVVELLNHHYGGEDGRDGGGGGGGVFSGRQLHKSFSI